MLKPHNFLLKIIDWNGLMTSAQVKDESILNIWLASHIFSIDYTEKSSKMAKVEIILYVLSLLWPFCYFFNMTGAKTRNDGRNQKMSQARFKLTSHSWAPKLKAIIFIQAHTICNIIYEINTIYSPSFRAERYSKKYEKYHFFIYHDI